MIEELKCENNDQLTRRERYYFELLKPSLNKNFPNRSLEEYQRDVKRIKMECECGGKFTKDHKAKHLKTGKHKKYIEKLMS
jgi:hypothetical protein